MVQAASLDAELIVFVASRPARMHAGKFVDIQQQLRSRSKKEADEVFCSMEMSTGSDVWMKELKSSDLWQVRMLIECIIADFHAGFCRLRVHSLPNDVCGRT